jgi:hypothetical protein
MKLTKQQIQALAKEIHDELKQIAVDEHEKEKQKAEKEITRLTKKYVTAYKKLPKNFTKIIFGFNDYLSNLDLEKHVFNKLMNEKVKPKTIKLNEIENKIIIASIDSKDLEELKKKITF